MKLLSNCESKEYLLNPTFTFGVINISTLDESNIDDDILEEGVHAQKPTEIQNLAENMENTNLNIHKKFKLQDKDNKEFTMHNDTFSGRIFKVSNVKSKSTNNCNVLIQDLQKISIKEEIHELLHELVVLNKSKKMNIDSKTSQSANTCGKMSSTQFFKSDI